MNFSTILYQEKGSIATVTLNRPDSINALSLETIEEIMSILKDQQARDDVSALVFNSSGKNFSSGHFLRELVQGDPRTYRQVFARCSEMMETIHRLPVPVIASVRGAAFAAGCQLVAACDLAVASETARFATPGVRIGLFCATPMVPLTRCVGRKVALDMLISGRVLSAAEALAHGLVSRVVTDDRLEEETRALAETIAGYSRSALRSGKAAFYRQIEMGEHEALFYTREVIAHDLLNHDAVEGITAFLEKRNPEWRHD